MENGINRQRAAASASSSVSATIATRDIEATIATVQQHR